MLDFVIVGAAQAGLSMAYFLKQKKLERNELAFNEEIISLKNEEIDYILETRKKALNYKLKGDELGSKTDVLDTKGLLQSIQKDPNNSFYEEKKKTLLRVLLKEDLSNVRANII